MKVIKDLFTPSGRKEKPHHRGATGAWHGLLGLQISFFWPWLLFILLLGYVGKEVFDIYKGGRVKDSLEDIAFVFSGVILGLSIAFNAHTFIILTAINVGCLWVMYKEHNNG